MVVLGLHVVARTRESLIPGLNLYSGVLNRCHIVVFTRVQNTHKRFLSRARRCADQRVVLMVSFLDW